MQKGTYNVERDCIKYMADMRGKESRFSSPLPTLWQVYFLLGIVIPEEMTIPMRMWVAIPLLPHRIAYPHSSRNKFYSQIKSLWLHKQLYQHNLSTILTGLQEWIFKFLFQVPRNSHLPSSFQSSNRHLTTSLYQ